MGKKKPFIDKKKATTYHVMHKGAGDGDTEGGDYVLVSDEQIAARIASATAQDVHSMFTLPEEPENVVDDEELRREILDLGLPDDGYNYLQHLRALGARRQLVVERPKTSSVSDASQAPSTAEETESSVHPAQAFEAPTADVAFVDARALAVEGTASNEQEARVNERDVSAFARRVAETQRLARHAAVREMEEVMAALEAADGARAAAAAAGGEGPPACVLGEGDLLDDFVLSAACAAADGGGTPHGTGTSARCGAGAASDVMACGQLISAADWDWGSDSGSSEECGVGAGGRSGRHIAPSIADTFWRPARHDRTFAQSIADERLVAQLDLEYGDDEIGSLEGEEEATRGAGGAEADEQLAAAAADFKRCFRRGRPVGDLPMLWQQRNLTAEQLAALDDEVVARLKALEAYERQAAAEAEREERRAAARSTKSESASLNVGVLAPRARQFDCESVLSVRSNYSYQPSRLGDATRPRLRRVDEHSAQRPAATPFELSAKTGLPRESRGGVEVQSSGSVCSDEASVAGQSVKVSIARGKGESLAEKKERKQVVKAAQRAAREVKKQMKGIYGDERMRAQRHMAASGVSASVTPLR